MKETLETIRREALSALEQTKAAQDLEALRVKYLGKKGELTAVLKQMGRMGAWLCRYRHRPRTAVSRFPPERQPSKS